MLQPARTKYRKAFKGKIHGVATRGAELNFGSFGLKAIEPNRVTSKEIEAARVALTRHMKRAGRVWLRIFPNIPVTKKPIEVRMGKGKGGLEYTCNAIKIWESTRCININGTVKDKPIPLYKKNLKTIR